MLHGFPLPSVYAADINLLKIVRLWFVKPRIQESAEAACLERGFHALLEHVYLEEGVQRVSGVGLGCVYLMRVLTLMPLGHVSLLINLWSVCVLESKLKPILRDPVLFAFTLRSIF